MKPMELVGQSNVLIENEIIADAPTLIRCVECHGGIIRNNVLWRPAGPPDPAGQCIQLDKCTGEWCIENNICSAGPGAEDLISIYGDKPSLDCTVYVFRNILRGRGDSDSSTSICVDGPYPPRCIVRLNRISGARVAIQVAGGTAHVVSGNKMVDCEDEVEVDSYYGVPIGKSKIQGWRYKGGWRRSK